MQRSTERILTTHTGSLPRPDDLIGMLYAAHRGEPTDIPALEARVREAVAEIVRKQVASGIDVVNDGEMGKVGYSTYVTERLTGFDGPHRPSAPNLEMQAYADYFRSRPASAFTLHRPSCTGPIAWRGDAAVRRDVANFQAANQGVGPADTFFTAASPGVVWMFLANEYYPTHEAYVFALADALKTEYDAIHRAGFLLQVDCPDLAAGWLRPEFADATVDDFRKRIELHIAALNHALADIPPDRLRLHVCWGNYEGPHTRDVPLASILDLLLTARPAGLSFEAANPRHEHEWKLFQDVKLPEGKVLIPGVLDSTTNFVEHPELVAERIVRFARLVGRENVIAGTDCGFSTFAGMPAVHPTITWVKFQAMAEGARLASEQLWP